MGQGITDEQLQAMGLTLGKSSHELPPPDAAHSVADHDWQAYEQPPHRPGCPAAKAEGARLAGACRQAASDIRGLLAIACVGDGKEEAERFKALYAGVLQDLEAAAARLQS
jgi:hypothetical protein